MSSSRFEGVKPCLRLCRSNLNPGDRVALLEGTSTHGGDAYVVTDAVKDSIKSLGIVLAGEDAQSCLDGKSGTVVHVFDKALVVVSCKVRDNKTMPPSSLEKLVVVPMSCAFDLDEDAAREEYVLHRITRSLKLKHMLRSKLGDKDEVYLHIAKHLVPFCQNLMVFSGASLQRPFNSVLCRHFGPAQYWLEVSSLPSTRVAAASVSHALGGLLLCGGADNVIGSTFLNTVAAYDALTNAWSSFPPMNIRRHGCCGARVGGTVYVFGGAYAEAAHAAAARGNCTGVPDEERRGGSNNDRDRDPWLPFYEHLDLRTAHKGGKWQAEPHGAGCQEAAIGGPPFKDRVFAACGVLPGLGVVLAGGKVAIASSSVRNRYSFEYRIHTVFEVVRSCECFCPDTRTWSPLPSMKEARVGAAFAVWQCRYLVVAGGQNEHKHHLSTVEIFDGVRWDSLPELNVGRLHAAMVVWNGVLTVIGGTDVSVGGFGKSSEAQCTSTVEKYVPAAQKWCLCPNLELPNALHTGVAAGLNN